MVTKRTIIWTKLAEEQLEAIYNYIKDTSIQNAEKLKIEILESTLSLIDYPEKYPNDKYKEKNNGTFKAYEIYKYRISYNFLEDKIIILRIRSTQMKPKTY
ncbi:MAG TPA: type II toxin-antitoxin system RelE/ParE family toxin [Chitinophagales bacterium]|nr:type II toxin-antitoxin system RelE/ParE family toxin [Chitinophagales bacterium]